MTAGMASTDRTTSGPIARVTSMRASEILSTPPTRHSPSVADGVFDRLQDVVCLRKDRFFELGCVGNRCIERANAVNRRVEILEQLAGNPCGDLGAETARQLILVRDDDAARFLDECGDGVPVVRRDRP